MKWLLVIAALFAASSVHAQQIQQCAPYRGMAAFLNERHNEARIWGGVVPAETGAVEIELWQSKSGSWTLLQLSGDMACMMAAGVAGEAPIVGDEV